MHRRAKSLDSLKQDRRVTFDIQDDSEPPRKSKKAKKKKKKRKRSSLPIESSPRKRENESPRRSSMEPKKRKHKRGKSQDFLAQMWDDSEPEPSASEIRIVQDEDLD